MINKNKFSIRNTKKVLHKVGKQWVVVSAVLLGLVAGGAAVNETANASANVSSAPVASTNAPSKKASIINKVKANKGNVVTDAVKATNEYVKSGTPNYSSASSAYNGLASMAKTNNLSQFSNEVSLGNPYSENSNTWMGEFNTAKSYANELNSPRLNGYIGKVNSLLNTNISSNKKLQNIPLNNIHLPSSLLNNDVLSKSPLVKYANAEKAQIEDTDYLNQYLSSAPESIKKAYLIVEQNHLANMPNQFVNFKYNGIDINGHANVNESINQIINNKNVQITFTDGSAHLTGESITGNSITPNGSNINAFANNLSSKAQSIKTSVLPNLVKLQEALQNYKSLSKLDKMGLHSQNISPSDLPKITKKVNGLTSMYNQLEENADPTTIESEITNINRKVQDKIKAINNTANLNMNNEYNSVSLAGKNITLPIPENFSSSDIISILDGNHGTNHYSNDTLNNLISSEAHTAIESAATQQMNGNSAKASNYLDKAADAIKAGNMMLGSADMTRNYNGLVDQLAALPNAQSTNAGQPNKSPEPDEANDLYTAAADANSLASNYQSGTSSASYDDPADKESVVSYLDDAARQATSVANSLDNDYNKAHQANIQPKHNPNNEPYIDTVNISGAYSAHSEFSGKAGTPESVSARSGFHFTNDNEANSSVYSFSIGNSNSTIDLNVASNSSVTPPSPVKPQPTPQPSNPTNTNTSKGTYVPQVASSSSANSSVASSSASASVAPASVDVNDLPPVIVNGKSENEKHAVNYAKVVKALQLHTNPNFTKRNGVAVVKPGSVFKIEKSVKAHNGALRYEVKYNKKNYFITANKRFVNAYYKAAKHVNHANHSVNNYVHYRYAKVIKHLQLHTSAKFTKRNGVKAVRPGAEFHINRIVKNHGLVRYEVRHNHKNYFITASHHYTVNAYVQKYNFRKHGYKAVRVIKPLDEYRKLGFSKRNFIRHFYRGSVLPVKKVVTISSGEMTRLQLTNGRYVSANKDFVEPIR